MCRTVRNRDWLPHIGREGLFCQQLPVYVEPRNVAERLFSHHTLCSVRHARLFFRPCVPKDSLDIALASTYQHEREVFPEKMDAVLQPETVGLETWRLLRNRKMVPPTEIVNRGHPITYSDADDQTSKDGRRTKDFGKKSIYSVKLGIASNHIAQTNAGYSRKKEAGGYYAV